MPEKQYPRISQAEYNKLMFQATGQVDAILHLFECYGQQNVEVPQARHLFLELLENFGMAVRGKPAPIHVVAKVLPTAMGREFNIEEVKK
jgi:hypothetical protein